MIRFTFQFLVITIITSGVLPGQKAPALTTGPEKGHLIMVGDHFEGLSLIRNVAIFNLSRWSAKWDTNSMFY